MAALLGADLAIAQAVCDAAAEGEICTVANDNDPSQVVISGHRAAIERALEIAKEKGAKRAILLPVSAPFHCPLMKPAAEAMQQALAGVKMEPPAVSLYANVTAAPVDSPDTIRELLVEQVTGMVRWRESVAAMAAAGVTHFVEFGGKVLGPMVKRIAPDAEATSVITMEISTRWWARSEPQLLKASAPGGRGPTGRSAGRSSPATRATASAGWRGRRRRW